MKKIVLVFFTALYLVSISGLAVSNFYCCGKFKESFLFLSEKITDCCSCSMEVSSCCDTKTFYVKVKDDHSPSQLKLANTHYSISNFIPVSILSYSFYPVTESLSSLIHAPPLIGDQPVFLLVHSFRI